MKIKYLQQMHDAEIGEERDVDDLQAKVLIQLGAAEALSENNTAKAPKRKTKGE